MAPSLAGFGLIQRSNTFIRIGLESGKEDVNESKNRKVFDEFSACKTIS